MKVKNKLFTCIKCIHIKKKKDETEKAFVKELHILGNRELDKLKKK